MHHQRAITINTRLLLSHIHLHRRILSTLLQMFPDLHTPDLHLTNVEQQHSEMSCLPDRSLFRHDHRVQTFDSELALLLQQLLAHLSTCRRLQLAAMYHGSLFENDLHAWCVAVNVGDAMLLL